MKKIFAPLRVFLALLSVCILCPGLAPALEGKIIHVSDGDTVTLLTSGHKKIKIRLYRIDTPEKAQPYGTRAKQFTAQKIANKQVTVEEYGIDRYGRIVGIVKTGRNTSLNEELLKNGLAWYYEKYCRIPICGKWKNIEQNAKRNKIGLFQDKNAIPPWNWRKKLK